MRKLNLAKEIGNIHQFIKKNLKKSGLNHIIIGLSGGIDSAVTCKLCCDAIGPKKIYAFMLPSQKSEKVNLTDAIKLAEKYQIKYKIIQITKLIEHYFNFFDNKANRLRIGNFAARIRMAILYDMSKKHNGLVIGTGNKSEILTGYFTQHGDGACAFEPLGHIYKTEVIRIAHKIGIPKNIINKKPSADLWQGQTDEAEMGITYQELDEILYHLYDCGESKETVIKHGYDKNKIEKVINLKEKSEFKRNLPPIPTIIKD